MSNISHASVIPLIGGELLASDEVFERKPEWIGSYPAFEANESHLINYYKWKGYDVPYFNIDDVEKNFEASYVDVVSSVCPCAGLSQAHASPGEHNTNNEWMPRTAEFVFDKIRPKVYWGENAPALAGKIGKFMRDILYEIAQKHDYGFTLYLTKSLQHGTPQYRRRTFYFFWDKKVFGNRVPVFNYYNRPYTTIEELIINTEGNTLREPINPNKPSEDPYYRYLLEVVHGGISHKDYIDLIEKRSVRSMDIMSTIEKTEGHNFLTMSKWMRENGYDREADRCIRKYEKLQSGGSIMRRGTMVPKDYIGAFVLHYPNSLTHPVEDRYISYREAMNIMGLPSDMELLDPKNSVNHICQNVPYKTAKDMAFEVKESILGNREMLPYDYVFQSNLSQKVEIWTPEEKSDLAQFM